MRQLGFSLLEMLVVMSLMAMLFLMTSPYQSAFLKAHESQLISKKLRQALEMSRSLAIANGRPVLFCLSQDALHCAFQGRYALVFRDIEKPEAVQEDHISYSLDFQNNEASLYWRGAFHALGLVWYPDGGTHEMRGSFRYFYPKTEKEMWEIRIASKGHIRFVDMIKS